jgi:hypothetical protein
MLEYFNDDLVVENLLKTFISQSVSPDLDLTLKQRFLPQTWHK